MSRRVAGGSVASRILLLLGERCPITEKEVALALGLRGDVVARELRKLQAGGLVVLEDLDGTTYCALTGAGATHVGLPAKEIARLKARRPPPPKPRDDADPAFG